MNGHNLVAVYNLRDDAERVRDRLIAFGIPATDIRLSSAVENAGAAAALTDGMRHERHHGFWDWLFGDDAVPEHDRSWYHANLREGRAAVSRSRQTVEWMSGAPILQTASRRQSALGAVLVAAPIGPRQNRSGPVRQGGCRAETS